MELGLTSEPTSLLANSSAVYVFQSCMSLWKGLGWSAVIYWAAIAGIDQEEYEAAEIDGASRMQKIWYITVPSLILTFIVLMLMRVGSFVGTGLDQYLVFYNGMVADKIEILDLYVYWPPPAQRLLLWYRHRHAEISNLDWLDVRHERAFQKDPGQQHLLSEKVFV